MRTDAGLDPEKVGKRPPFSWALSKCHSRYRVEFTTYGVRTAAVAKVSTGQIRPLGSKEIDHARAFEPAVR